MVISRSQKRLSAVLLPPITSGAEWGGCLVLSVALGSSCPWDTAGCSILGRMDRRPCWTQQLLCWASISSFAVGSSPSDSDSSVKSSQELQCLSSLKVGNAGDRGRGLGFCFCFSVVVGFLFAFFFSPWRVHSSVFQAVFYLQEIPMKWSEDLRVCELLLYFES